MVIVSCVLIAHHQYAYLCGAFIVELLKPASVLLVAMAVLNLQFSLLFLKIYSTTVLS